MSLFDDDEELEVVGLLMMFMTFFGAGRFFDNFDLALAAYKSSVMKTIISTAREHITENPEEYNKMPSDSIERYL